jgi:Lon protease-like protein
MCDIGTVAKIVKLIKMPDGGTTIIIQGKKRFRVGKHHSNRAFLQSIRTRIGMK